MAFRAIYFRGEIMANKPPVITYYGRELEPTRVEPTESGNGYLLYYAGQADVYLPLSMLAQQMAEQGYIFRGYDAGRFGTEDEYQCVLVERKR